MWTKRILILLPVAVCLFLAQSYFWVPTYEEQARATPERLGQYITSSIGDAEILNPILNADGTSSSICGLVFEGLIDRDRDLSWRGRLATHWEISEEAYFVVNSSDKRTPEQIAALIRAEMARTVSKATPLSTCVANITDVEIMPAETITEKLKEAKPAKKGEEPEKDKKPEMVDVTVTVRRPARIKLTLKKVDQDLFKTLSEFVGKDYFSSFKAQQRISVTPAAFDSKKPDYAETFLPATEHNPVIVFHLRKGVRFHDGHEFDSGDVKFTYEAIMEPRNRSPRTSDYEPVKSVSTPDKFTVRVVYKRLFSPAFGSWAMEILPEHLLNSKVMRAEAKARNIPLDEFNMRRMRFNRHPIGCGPYRFAEWQSDEFIALGRNEDYWEGAPEYREYMFRIIPDPVTQEMEFYAGAVDSYGARPDQAERLAKDARFKNFSMLGLGYSYIGYNRRRELFKDKRVRRALGMAIDVDKIIKYVLYEQGSRITGPFPLQTDFYDHGVKPLPFDPDGALKLFNEAGWKKNADGILEKDGKPFRFTLITNQGNLVRKDITEIAQHYWRQIGVEVDIEIIEWAVFIKKHIDVGDFDACVLGWGMGLDPDLYQIWHSSQSGPNKLNFCAYENKEADDLIVRIRREYEHAKQVEMCHRLHAIIGEDQPYTFLFVQKSTLLMAKLIYVVRRDKTGRIIGYEEVKTNKLGRPGFDFIRWIKLSKEPEHLLE